MAGQPTGARRPKDLKAEPQMRTLFALLLAATIACGAAAGVTVALGPASPDDGQGY